MKLNEKDLKLVNLARSLVKEKKVLGGVIKEAGCALETSGGRIFTGASMDIQCGIGFCAEHSAIANMISHSDETEIKTIVAAGTKIISPCGRCRELMRLIDKNNWKNTEVIISSKEKVKLKDLLPGSWI